MTFNLLFITLLACVLNPISLRPYPVNLRCPKAYFGKFESEISKKLVTELVKP